MKTMYRVGFGYGIREVHVERESASSVWLATKSNREPRRELKRSRSCAYFESYAEAYEFAKKSFDELVSGAEMRLRNTEQDRAEWMARHRPPS